MPISAYLVKHKRMIILSIFFFYLGSAITISFLQIDCVGATQNSERYTSSNTFQLVEYAVLILSAPNNLERRDVVRLTWGSFLKNVYTEKHETFYEWNHTWTKESKGPLKYYFVIGIKNMDKAVINQLTTENNKHNDLLMLDSFEDAYNNLSMKVLHALKWFSENLENLKYVIKSDDDSFVRIDLIAKELDDYAPSMNSPELEEFITYKKNLSSYKGLYWGYFNGDARVFLSGKWKEQNWFLCNSYLPYALGGGYVISRSIVDYVAKNSDFISLYNSEDVSMGVWTAALDGINRVHDIRFDTEWESRGCAPHMLVRHKQTSANMQSMYKTLISSQGQTFCKKEYSIRKHYIYNWNVLPSKCCKL